MPYAVFSPCGTSILTNVERARNTHMVPQFANAKRDEIPQEDRDQLEEIVLAAKERLAEATRAEAARLSAELNAIDKFYGGRKPDPQDQHYLIVTDTWLGRETAEIIEKWLRDKLGVAQVIPMATKGLQTRDFDAFQWALSDLLKEISERAEVLRKSKVEVVFNLTGGFKAIQGFLQSIAHFYADKSIYVFERSDRLMEIPRIPVKIASGDIIRKHLAALRRLAAGDAPPRKTLAEVPETLLIRLDDLVGLSPYGEVQFAACTKDLYEERLWPSPNPGCIRYADAFEKEVSALPPDRRRLVNQQIDRFLRYLKADRESPPDSLGLKKLKAGRIGSSTHEFYAWSDKDARRIFCHQEGKTFVLDRLDKHL